ncbi:MAG: hypothetical protein GX601_16425 [Anaerolineales bacterium]|nr:hypothetical protein [Anaerolineales bacterium]
MRLISTTVDGLERLQLDDATYHVLILPEVGAKIASLVCKETGEELLFRNPDRPFRRPDYGGAFDAYDYSGFDDCFPNIAAGPYPGYPWDGIPLPDHGELWTLPWNWEFTDGELHLWAHGVRLPYRFDRWLASRGDTLELRYQVTNLAPFDIRALYAAHCLFAVQPDTRILLPDGVRVRVDWSKDSRLGTVCDAHAWPTTQDTHGNPVDLSLIRSGELGTADKVYTTRLDEGWCALHHPATGRYMAFTFSPAELPYVGVWINQGGWPLQGQPCFHAALEPCTGFPDRLDIAVPRNEAGTVPARGSCSWRLRLWAGRSTDAASLVSQLRRAG